MVRVRISLRCEGSLPYVKRSSAFLPSLAVFVSICPYLDETGHWEVTWSYPDDGSESSMSFDSGQLALPEMEMGLYQRTGRILRVGVGRSR